MKKSISSFLLSRDSKNCSPRTIEWYDEQIARFADFCKLKDPANVRPTHIREFFIHVRNNGVSSNTIHGYYRALKAFFNWLEREGEIEKNPMDKIEAPKRVKKVVDAFTEREIARMLREFDEKRFTGLRNQTIVLTLLGTGMRVSELCNLKVEHVQLREAQIQIVEEDGRIKGNKERTIPMGDRLRNALSKWLQRREEWLERRRIYTDYVFPSDEGRCMDRSKVTAMIKVAGKRAGVEGKRLSAHTFRHTFAKMSMMNGADVFTLQKILGHSSLEMVKVYVELFGSDIQRKFRKFDPLDRL